MAVCYYFGRAMIRVRCYLSGARLACQAPPRVQGRPVVQGGQALRRETCLRTNRPATRAPEAHSRARGEPLAARSSFRRCCLSWAGMVGIFAECKEGTENE